MPQARRMTRSRAVATKSAPLVPRARGGSGAAARKSRRVSAPTTAPGGRRKAKGTPKTPRDPPPLPPLQQAVDEGEETEDMEDVEEAAADEDDFEDEDEANVMEMLPKDVRRRIFSMISTDAETLAPYRTVSKMFAHYCDSAVQRFAINGTIRIAMFRHHLSGHDPTKLLWDLVGRFADTIQHLDFRDTPHLDDLKRISDYPELRTLNLASCWGVTDLEGVGKCPELRELRMSGCTHMEDISTLITCKHLQEVDAGFCMALKDVTVFDDCPELQKVTVPARLDETDSSLTTLQCRETPESRPHKIKYVKVIFV
jgi:hypothetical protein